MNAGVLASALVSILLAASSGSDEKMAGENTARLKVAFSLAAEVWGYDPTEGTEEKDILENFNLHRGRWWNYYQRGSWLLAHGHYEAAQRDFRVVVAKRPTDKRDARTYGMHFMDCFGHRELGIALYRQVSKKGPVTPSDLKDAIEHLDTSRQQAASSRAEFFLKRAKELFWKNADDSAPAISIENAARTGQNWAIVFSNRPVVALTICVTDGQSGVDAVWVNAKQVSLQASKPQTVYVPVAPHDPWIVLGARDGAGNRSVPTVVRVHMDVEAPLVFAAAHPKPMEHNGSVVVECSGSDNLGLSTIEVGDHKIDCDARCKYTASVAVRCGPDKGRRIRVRATDLAGNTVKGSVAIVPNEGKTQPRPAFLDTGLPPHVWFRSREPLLLRNVLESGRSASIHAWGISGLPAQITYGALMASVPETVPSCFPLLAFEDYRPVRDGYPVPSDRYWVQGRIEHAFGVEAIAIDDTVVFRVDPNSESVLFGHPVSLDRDIQSIRVEARCADGHPVRQTLKIKKVPDITIKEDYVYSLVVLPLSPEGTPSNPRPDGPYPNIADAVVACTLGDPMVERMPTSRFDCRKMKGMDVAKELRILGVEKNTPGWQVLRVGKKHGVDLGLWGVIREYNENFEITVYVLDIETERYLPVSPIDIHGPTDERDWYVNALIQKLKTSLPRVRASVADTSIKRYNKRIYLNQGIEQNLFLGQELWIFEEESVPSGAALAEATVDVLWSGRSEAKVAERDGSNKRLSDFEPDQLFVLTK